MTNGKLNILLLSAYYLPGYKGGGPIKTTKNLVDNVGLELNFNIITSDRDLGDNEAYGTINFGAWNKIGNALIYYVNPSFSGYRKIGCIIKKKDYDLVYLNSFFSIRFSFFPMLIARMLGQKIIVAPRGEFSEGALIHKSVKKRAFISVYKLLGFHRIATFQASSDLEKEDIRQVLGKEIDIRVAENIGSQDYASVIPAKPQNTLKAVFVSRISPIKNLLGALAVLADVKTPITYDIFGPKEDLQYWELCQEKIKALPDSVQVNYKGPLLPQEVVSTITGYDVFFMPTKGENYGHVIAEALCAGLPLLIADTTPWRNLQEKLLGWDLPLASPKAFVSVLDELAAMPPEEHFKMRENVLAWAKHKFAQQDAIEANIAMFRYAYEKMH